MAFRKNTERQQMNSNDEQTKRIHERTNDVNEQMKKKGINKEMHGVRAVRACKYDTKFYLISLPRDTTPKFIHR